MLSLVVWSIVLLTVASSDSRAAPPPDVIVLVHGTTAVGRPGWRLPGSPTWKLLQGRTDARLLHFDWSGGTGSAVGDDARDVAARQLREFIRRESPSGARVHIIAHSHGGNVVFRALDSGMKADDVVLLGTPILNQYMHVLSTSRGSRIENVGWVYNVFDRDDCWQTERANLEPDPFRSGEGAGRTIPAIDNGENINVAQVVPAARKPGLSCGDRHGALHDPEILQALIDSGRLSRLPLRRQAKAVGATQHSSQDECAELRSQARARATGVSATPSRPRGDLVMRQIELMGQLSRASSEAEKQRLRAEMDEVTRQLEPRFAYSKDQVDRASCDELRDMLGGQSTGAR